VCAGPQQCGHRPGGRRLRRSSRGRRGHTRRLWCRGRRPAQSNRGQRRPRRHPVPGRPSGCRSRCSAGAVGVHRRQSAVRAWGRPSRRAICAPSHSRRPPRPPATRPVRGTAASGRRGPATADGPAGASRRRAPTRPAATPSGHRVHGGGPANCSKAGQPHERGRRSCPPLGLVAEPADSTANNAHPSANPSSTTPVRACSSAGTNGAATNTTATSSPTASDRATINPSLV